MKSTVSFISSHPPRKSRFILFKSLVSSSFEIRLNSLQIGYLDAAEQFQDISWFSSVIRPVMASDIGNSNGARKQLQHAAGTSDGDKQPQTAASTTETSPQPQNAIPTSDGDKQLQAAVPTGSASGNEDPQVGAPASSGNGDKQPEIAAPVSENDQFSFLVALGRIIHHAAWKYRERLVASNQDHPHLKFEDPITFNNTFLRKKGTYSSHCTRLDLSLTSTDEKLSRLDALQVLSFLEAEGHILTESDLTAAINPPVGPLTSNQANLPVNPTADASQISIQVQAELSAKDYAGDSSNFAASASAKTPAPQFTPPPGIAEADIPATQIATPPTTLSAGPPDVPPTDNPVNLPASVTTAPSASPFTPINAPPSIPAAANISTDSSGSTGAIQFRTQPGSRWTDEEKDCIHEAMKIAVVLYPDDKDKNKIWPFAHNFVIRYGFNRSASAIRMYWNREGRERYGLDERSQNRVKNKHILSTSLQTGSSSSPRKRKGAANDNQPAPKRSRPEPSPNQAQPTPQAGDAQQLGPTQNDATIHAPTLPPQTSAANFPPLAPYPSFEPAFSMSDLAAQYMAYESANYAFNNSSSQEISYPPLPGELASHTAQPANPYAASQMYVGAAQPTSTSDTLPPAASSSDEIQPDDGTLGNPSSDFFLAPNVSSSSLTNNESEALYSNLPDDDPSSNSGLNIEDLIRYDHMFF